MHRGTFKRLKVFIAAVTVFALIGPMSFQGISFAPTSVRAANDAVITGKILKPDGKAFNFTCGAPKIMEVLPPPPGTPPPGGELPPGGTPPPGGGTSCGVWVNAMGGPGVPGAGSNADTTTGAFTLNVQGGIKHRIEFMGPMDQMGAYTFPVIYVEILSGQTKDLGTLTATQKGGHIKGILKNDKTGVPIPNVQVNAFPIFGGQEGPGGPEGPGPMMPSVATTGADGRFDIAVNAGRYGINIMPGPNTSFVSSGKPVEAFVETDTTTVEGIELTATLADATITGSVLNEAGTQVTLPGGVGARPVGATDFFDYNGPINPPGTYTVKVPSTTAQYSLTIHMPPGSEYSLKESVTVTVVPNGTVTQNLMVVKNSSSIYGKVVSQSGFALGSCQAKGDKFKNGFFGEVFAHSEKSGIFANAQIKSDCTYVMSLGVGQYRFGYRFSPDAGYINKPSPEEEITVAANQNIEKNITVIAGDATITGQVFDANGKALANVWVDAGNEGEARKDFQTGGTGEGPGGPGGPGEPGDFVGPGGAKSPEEMMKYCSDPKNKTECQNFKLPPGATGPGGCTNMLACVQYCEKNPKVCQEFDKGGSDKPSGQSVLGKGPKKMSTAGRVRRNAESVTTKPQGPDFLQNVIHVGGQTDINGKFTLSVVSGHVYEVRTNCPPDKDCRSMIPPKAVAADMRTAKTANVVLQFRNSFGTLTGKVFMPDGSAADRCFVHYWSKDGGGGGAPCNKDGSFSLGYDKGVMNIGADSFNGKDAYRTKEEAVTITTEKKITKNFTLAKAGFEMPLPTSETFDATAQKTIALSDGTQLDIPAGALGESGNVTCSATPTVDMPTSESASSIGKGYSFSCTDANGKEITDFNSDVKIKMPYDEDYVKEDLGLNPNLLKCAYVSDTTNSYSDCEKATRSDGSFTVSTDHFTDYTIVSPGGVNLMSVSVASSGKNTKVTIDGTKSFTLKGKKDTWNVGTANFGKVGQRIIASSMSAAGDGKILLYNTSGKKVKTIKYPGFKGGLNQVVEDVTAKSGNAPDGTEDIMLAPATKGPATALIINLKDNKLQTVKTGVGTGATALNTAELFQAGLANPTTLFDGKTSKAWKMSKGKLIEAKGASVTSSLVINNGKVEKKVVTPKVKKVSPSKCSTSSSTKLTIQGTGFGTSAPIVLWNATAALAVKLVKSNQTIQVTVNPSAVDVKAGTNTMTIVNDGGQAGVGVVTCN